MKRFQCYWSLAPAALLAAWLTACTALQGGVPAPFPGNGPGGKPMPTADQQAVGMSPAPLEPTVYPVAIALGRTPGAAGTGGNAYAWLQNLDTPAVKQWIAAQNKLSEQHLAAIPARGPLRERLAQLTAQEREGVPVRAGGRYFFLASGRDQGALQVADSRDAPGRTLVTGRVRDFAPAPGGNLVAYGLGQGETLGWRFRAVTGGQEIPDRLVARYGSVSWAHDGTGVYYTGGPGARPAVYFHRLGEPQESDTRVYTVTDHPAGVPLAQVTPDGHYLVITVVDGEERNALDLLDLSTPRAKPLPLFPAWDAYYAYLGSTAGHLYFLTTRNASQGRVISVSAQDPLAGWDNVISETAGELEGGAVVGNRILVRSIEDAHGVVRLYALDGRPAGEVALPGLGHVGSLVGDGTQAFFTYSDYVTPPVVYRLDLTSAKAHAWHAPAAALGGYVTDATYYLTKDGLRLPIYITHRQDAPRDGNQPLILRGFNTPLVPRYRAQVQAWLEAGGSYAEARVRGSTVQYELDDMAAAADYLTAERYTRSRRLGLYGRGMGALLASDAALEHPELFAAVVAQLGPRSPLLTTARQEPAPSDPSLQAYVPAEHLGKGVCYAPTFVTTADHDEQLPPWLGYQLAAALQAVQFCSHPILLHVVPAAAAESAQVQDSADSLAFLSRWLGIGDLGGG